jgi:drug/metabolite transporter (DMT)-like permease
MPSRPLDTTALALLILLCVSWGLQQVAVKVALPAFPPLMQLGLRSAGGCLMVVAWCVLRRRGGLTTRDGTLWWGLAAGALFAAEFVLIYLGLQWTEASRTSLFIYTAPFFVALGARWVLPEERLGPAQWLGIALSFAGVAIALGVPRHAASAQALVGDIMILVAGALWAATTLVIKASPLRAASPEKVLIYQLAAAALAGLLGALIAGERVAAPVSAVAVAGLLYQTVWVAGVTFLVWFQLLSAYPASTLQAGTSMTPLFGVALAALTLGEPITLWFAIAVLLVAVGLILVNRRGAFRARQPSAAAARR